MIASQIKTKRISILDILVVLLMAGLLYYGASWQIFGAFTDAARYQCYTVAFWHGLAAVQNLQAGQCHFLLHPDAQLIPLPPSILTHKMQQLGLPAALIQFVSAQSSPQPFHVLPYEYPMLTLIPFSLSMVVPSMWFQVAFAFWMLVIAAALYFVLLRWKSREAAIVYAFYLVVGCWGTMAGRFDIIPSAFTLISIICAEKKRWNWAFLLLALGVLYKFYPVYLLIPFLIAQQKEIQGSWRLKARWIPFIIFVVLCAVVMSISLLFNVEGTISPFSYFSTRPIQVESLSASILWIVDHLLSRPIQYVYTYGSLNMLASGASILSILVEVANLVGVIGTLWLLWRGKIGLAMSSLLLLLIIIATGKVFSPQYLIWILPLIAYVGEAKRVWVVIWGLIGLLTTWIYPFIYRETHNILVVPHLIAFFPATTVRNFLLAGFVIGLLYFYFRRPLPTSSATDLDNEEIADSSTVVAVPQG